jgi:hypothetical protein
VAKFAKLTTYIRFSTKFIGAVLRWLKGSSEEETLARAIANGDKQAIAAALTSGKVQVKKRK